MATEATSGPRSASISVVVASRRERALLTETIVSLLPQSRRLGAELIVAREDVYGDMESLRAQYPEVRFLAAAPGADVPVLRGIGLAAATGELVAVTEDHCIADDRWLDELIAHATPDTDVVGGRMDNARRRRAIEWGAFFSEYGLYSSNNGQATSTSQLTAANVMYRAGSVKDVCDWTQAGEWENVVHDRLAARGARMVYVPSATVQQNQTYVFRGFMADRFRHGYRFAKARVAQRSISARLLMALATPALPMLFVLRLVRTAAPGRWWTFTRALPLTFAFLAAWTAGEAVGYLSRPRRSSVGA